MAGSSGKKPNTAELCAGLAAPVAERMGVYLWDVVFEKEGAGWYLRYFIDKEPDGVNIGECEEFSRAMSDILDAADPIEQAYYLEVGSPGIERRLVKGWHFQKYTGSAVVVRLIRPVEGVREFAGVLRGCDETDGRVTLDLGGDAQMTFTLDEAAYVRLDAAL